MSKENENMKDIISNSKNAPLSEIDKEQLKSENLSGVRLQKKAKNKKQGKFRKFIKRHKVLTVILCILLCILIAFGVIFAVKASASNEASYSFIRTTTLAKGSLDDSISATGSVGSANTSNVTTSLNYTIKTVAVAVGDTVKEGDVICTLDTSDLESQIEKEQENIARSLSQAQASYSSAKQSYEKAVSTLNNYKSTLNDAKSDKQSAYTPYNTAKSVISSTLKAYNTALTNYNSAGAKYVSALNEYNSALSKFKSNSISKSQLISAANSYIKATQNLYGGCSVGTYDISGESSSSSNSASSSVSQSNNSQSVNSANSSSGGAESVSVTKTASEICSQVVSTVKQLTNTSITISTGSNTLYKLSVKASALKNAKSASNYDNLESAYQTALSAYTQAQQNYEQYSDSVTQAKQQLTSAQNELDNASTSDTLSELQSQLDECTLKAGQDGTVTALNATVGSSSNAQQAIATIQDLDNLIISISIEEADINNASVGMTCLITSDAVEDTLNGKLTQIDPTSSESGSFGAQVSVTSKASGLLIGMNASVQIIVSSSEDVYQVPIDAIGTDEEKGEFVYRQTGGSGTDMTFEKVYVSTGEKNDYYIEIESDDLSDGDVIRSNSDLSEGIETVSNSSSTDSSSGFNLSSLFGGGSDRSQKMGNMGAGNFNPNSSGSSNQGSSGSGSSAGNAPMGAAPGGNS